MLGTALSTDAELEEVRRRRFGARASLACEGMFLTPEEEALVAAMDEDRLTPDARTARIVEFIRAKQKDRALSVSA